MSSTTQTSHLAPASSARQRTCRAVISLDIGQVLLNRGEPGEIPSERIPELPPVHGALDGAREIVRTFDRENVWIVSRCKPESEAHLLTWLAVNGFTGDAFDQVMVEHVRFCRERADKAAILQEIGASAHVDDRADVLAATRDIPGLLRVLFQPAAGEMARAMEVFAEDEFHVCYGWSELPIMLLVDLFHE